MKMFSTILVASVLASSLLICDAQTPSATPAQPAASAPATSSEILQPALDNVRRTLEGMRIDKWKRGSIRDEADANITTIQRDLQGTLPSLMKTADNAPATVSKVLPVSRNVDALYDVLVHVVEGARVVAPGDQVSQLQSAMDTLEKARVKLDEQLEQTAASQGAGAGCAIARGRYTASCAGLPGARSGKEEEAGRGENDKAHYELCGSCIAGKYHDEAAVDP